MKIIDYIAASGTHYELQVEGEGDIPKIISEDGDNFRIYDMSSDRSWDSLIAMSHDLKIEIVDWGSDVGD